MSSATDASVTPITRIWHQPLEEALQGSSIAPDPIATAKRIFAAALQSRRGACCASCGLVLRSLQPPQMGDIVILHIETTGASCSVLACSELCCERISRRGISLEDLE